MCLSFIEFLILVLDFPSRRDLIFGLADIAAAAASLVANYNEGDTGRRLKFASDAYKFIRECDNFINLLKTNKCK